MYMKTFLPLLLLIGAISIAACASSGGNSGYWDISDEMISQHAATQTTLGPGPSFDPSEGPAETAINVRLGELRIAAAEFNALRFRWQAEAAPSDLSVHYDLVTQLLESSNFGMSYAVQAFEEMSHRWSCRHRIPMRRMYWSARAKRPLPRPTHSHQRLIERETGSTSKDG